MEADIIMRANSAITNLISEKDKIIIVSNYDSFNNVTNYSFTNIDEAAVSEYDIGVWKIKQLKK